MELEFLNKTPFYAGQPTTSSILNVVKFLQSSSNLIESATIPHACFNGRGKVQGVLFSIHFNSILPLFTKKLVQHSLRLIKNWDRIESWRYLNLPT